MGGELGGVYVEEQVEVQFVGADCLEGFQVVVGGQGFCH